MHSNRLHTALFLTVVLRWPPDVRTSWLGGPRSGGRVVLMSHVWKGRGLLGLGGPVQLGPMHHGDPPEQNNRQTPVKTLPSRNFVVGR